MHRLFRLVTLGISAIPVALTAQGATPRTPLVGTWLGTLSAATELHIQLVLEDSAGKVIAKFTSLDQLPTPFRADSAVITGNELRAVWTPLGAIYTAKLDERQRLSGSFQQSGATLPLVMTRREVKPPLRPQLPVGPFPYLSDSITFVNRKAGITLAGTLTIPAGSGRHPAVVLVTGSGAQDRDETIAGHKPFLVIADYLTRRGIAVLRVDDRGVGKSGGNFASSTSADFAGDVLSAVSYLKGRNDITSIGVIGHSEGGIIAPMVATQSRDVDFIVLLAGPGVPGREIMLLQYRAVISAQGVSGLRLESLVARQVALMDVITSGSDEAAMRRNLDAYLEKELSLTKRNTPENLVKRREELSELTSPWMQFFLRYDPVPTLTRVKVPVLALNGTKDLQVTPEENTAAIKVALTAAGNKDFTVTLLPGLNHFFQTAGSGAPTEYATIEETFSPAALALIADWVAKRTRK